MTANDALRAAALLEAVPPQLHSPELISYALNLMGDADPDYTNVTGLRDALAALDAALETAPDTSHTSGAAAAIRWARSLIACAAEQAERDEEQHRAAVIDQVADLSQQLWAAQNEANQHALKEQEATGSADRYKGLFEAEQEKNRWLRSLIFPVTKPAGDLPLKGELFLAVLDEEQVVAACVYADRGMATALTDTGWLAISKDRLRPVAMVKPHEHLYARCHAYDDDLPDDDYDD